MEQKEKELPQHTVVRCIVRGCPRSCCRRNPRDTFNRVPNEPTMRQTWLETIGRRDLLHNTEEALYVCKIHFSEDCTEKFYRYVIDGEEYVINRVRYHLKKDAVPNLLLPGSKSIDVFREEIRAAIARSVRKRKQRKPAQVAQCLEKASRPTFETENNQRGYQETSAPKVCLPGDDFENEDLLAPSPTGSNTSELSIFSQDSSVDIHMLNESYVSDHEVNEQSVKVEEQSVKINPLNTDITVQSEVLEFNSNDIVSNIKISLSPVNSLELCDSEMIDAEVQPRDDIKENLGEFSSINNSNDIDESVPDVKPNFIYLELCISSLNLPSPLWAIHRHPQNTYLLICQNSLEQNVPVVNKSICFNIKSMIPVVYLWGYKVEITPAFELKSVMEVENFVKRVDLMQYCFGPGLRTQSLRSNCLRYFEKGDSMLNERRCPACKITRLATQLKEPTAVLSESQCNQVTRLSYSQHKEKRMENLINNQKTLKKRIRRMEARFVELRKKPS